jgi:hypothetical protein
LFFGIFLSSAGDTYRQMSQAKRKDKQMNDSEKFKEGVRYALEELRSVYGEGVEETDIWAEYMSEGENA